MKQTSLNERISDMEILNGGPLTKEQKDVVINYKMTTIISGQLYLGSLSDAWDFSQMVQNKITHVIQLLYDVSDFPKIEGVTYYHIPLFDDELSDILTVFNEYVPIIDEIINGGGHVLIHCALGISRSASLCVAYLIHKTKQSVSNVISTIKRPINPNDGFLKALLNYESIMLFK